MTHAPLKIGIVCYPTYGGSGVVAAEVGLGMARRGHCVHFIGTDPPRRFDAAPGVAFHSVEVCDYPVFQHPPYALALASKLVEVATWANLDVIHVHYALPHATSALLAGQILGSRAPRVVTSLHGTDVTIVGTDPSYLPITRYSVERSDAVTVPSRFLREATRELLSLPELAIDVVPNFVDTAHFTPPPGGRDRGRMTRLFALLGGPLDPAVEDAPTLVHVSNFRPVKRVHDVLSVFERVNAARPTRLLMIGDGPDRSGVEARVRSLGLHPRVRFLGRQSEFVDALRDCDVFVMPSRTESFGVAALEAMACGVPVVASNVGGLPEVVVSGETGELVACGDVEEMSRAVLDVVTDPARRERLGAQARERAVERFQDGPAIDRYEAIYRRVLERGARGATSLATP